MAKMKKLSFSLSLFSALSYGSQETNTTPPPQKKISLAPQKTSLAVSKRTEKVPSYEELLDYPRRNSLQLPSPQNDQTTKK